MVSSGRYLIQAAVIHCLLQKAVVSLAVRGKRRLGLSERDGRLVSLSPGVIAAA